MTPAERERHDQFLRLFISHEEAVSGFVRALVPTREDAREVMQEVAAVLWRKFDQLTSPDAFRRWAFGVARFEALASCATARGTGTSSARRCSICSRRKRPGMPRSSRPSGWLWKNA